MIIYIDESGTHLGAKHSTLALVYIKVDNAETFDKKIIETESELKITNFHWKDEKWETREKFVNFLLKQNFNFKVAVSHEPHKFVKRFPDILSHLLIDDEIKKIVIDGEKPRWYTMGLKTTLRQRKISVEKVVAARKESSYPGLRVADCLAGLVRYGYDNPDSPAAVWLNQFRKTGKLLYEFLLD